MLILFQGIKLSDSTTVFFHTTNHTFQAASDTPGYFPGQIAWYSTFSLPGNGIPNGSGFQPLLSPCPSVIFCVWVPQSSKFITPELYQYLLPAEKQFHCLNLQKKIWSLKFDLQVFVVVAGRYFLLATMIGKERTT